MQRPLVFISYSHQDEAAKDQLVSQLEVLEKAEILRLWVDDRIDGGGDWNREIQEAIQRASVAVLLVSAHYLSSDFIASREIPELLRRRRSHGLVVFPVIARHCVWKQVDWLSELNVRPKNGRPVWGGDGQPDEDLAAIAEEIALLMMKNRIEHQDDAGTEPDMPADLHQWMSLPGTGGRAGSVTALVKLLQSGEGAVSAEAARALKTIVADNGDTRRALQGEVILIPEGETVAGRGTDNPIVINDSTVSRRHFRIERRGRQLAITDLGSSNGTSLNGVPLPPREPQPLRNGDEIRVSNALGYTVCQDVFLVRQPSTAEPPAAPTKEIATIAPAARPASDEVPATPARFCSSCGRAIHAEAVFCRFCGTLAIPTVRVCSGCRSPVERKWKACPRCGHRLAARPASPVRLDGQPRTAGAML